MSLARMEWGMVFNSMSADNLLFLSISSEVHLWIVMSRA